MTGAPRTTSRGWLSSLAALVLEGAAAAQDGVPGTLRTIDGRTLTGALLVAEDRATLRTGAGAATLAVAEIETFECSNGAAVNTPAPHRVWLRSGHELPATRIAGRQASGGAPAALLVDTPSGMRVAVPLGMVRALRHAGQARPEPALFAADRQRPPANDDLIYVLKDGKAQRSAVTVTGIGAERILFSLRGDAYDFDLAGLAAVVFGDNTGFAPDRQSKPRTRVELTGGEYFEGRLLEVTASLVRCRLDEGVVVDVPVGKLLRLQVASDRVARLSELTPRVEQTPAFDRIWPWTIDRSIAGPGFVIAGRTFPRGIGLVPRTRLTYDVGGRFHVFEASIGVDDRGGPRAHAVFRVLVDDRVVFEAPKTRGQAAEAIRVDVTGGRALAIEVDFGDDYDLGDFCVFADARVVQQ